MGSAAKNFQKSIIGGPFKTFAEAAKCMWSHYPDDEDYAVHEVVGDQIYRYSSDGKWRRPIDGSREDWEPVR